MKYMKKVVSIIFCFIFVFSAFYINSYASDKQDFEYTISGGTIKIDKCNLNDKEVTIPDTINGYNVTAVDLLAFSKCYDIEKIIISKNIISIANGAFSNCSSLKTIVVSSDNNAYSVKDGVLFNKTLTELICYPAQKSGSTYTMPDSVETIKMRSFSGCKLISEIELSDNLKTISLSAFEGCENLDSIIMSSKVAKIEQNAFRECSEQLCIFYDGSKEQWNRINFEGNEKEILTQKVCCKDNDKEFKIKLTDKDVELSYSSKVPFGFKISNGSVLKLVNVTENTSSGIFKITANVMPLKSGNTTISAVAENGFVLCNFNCNVSQCAHSSFHFLKTEKAVTCEQDGKEIYACDNCDYTETRTVKATGHTFGEWKVDVKPTKDREGLEIRNCSCGKTESRTIPRLTTTPDESTNNTTTSYLLGDVDDNKKVNATDARKTLRYVAGLEKLSDNQLKAANVDGDKKVTATDARRILRYVAGLEKI